MQQTGNLNRHHCRSAAAAGLKLAVTDRVRPGRKLSRRALQAVFAHASLERRLHWKGRVPEMSSHLKSMAGPTSILTTSHLFFKILGIAKLPLYIRIGIAMPQKLFPNLILMQKESDSLICRSTRCCLPIYCWPCSFADFLKTSSSRFYQ